MVFTHVLEVLHCIANMPGRCEIQNATTIMAWLSLVFCGGMIIEILEFKANIPPRGFVLSIVVVPCIFASIWAASTTANQAARSIELFVASAASGAALLMMHVLKDASLRTSILVVSVIAIVAGLSNGNCLDQYIFVAKSCMASATAFHINASVAGCPRRMSGEAIAISIIAALYGVDGTRQRDPPAAFVWHGMLVVFIVLFSLASCRGLRQVPSQKNQDLVFFKGPTVIAFSTITALLGTWLGFRRRIGLDPLLWLRALVMTRDRLTIVATWAAILAVWVPAIALFRAAGIDRVSCRKLFHFVAIALFAFPANTDPELLSVAYGIVLGLFIWLEVFRVVAADDWLLSRMLTRFYAPFLAAQERTLAVAHIYLLFGCAATHWLSSLSDSDPLLRVSGVAVLGAGDAAAALVGRAFGSIHWPASRRTVEGSLAFAFATSIALRCLVATHQEINATPVRRGMWFPAAAVKLSLFEASISQTDNLFLPLLSFTMLQTKMVAADPTCLGISLTCE